MVAFTLPEEMIFTSHASASTFIINDYCFLCKRAYKDRKKFKVMKKRFLLKDKFIEELCEDCKDMIYRYYYWIGISYKYYFVEVK